MAPVELHELLGKIQGVERELRGLVVAPLDREVGQGEEEGVFVGRHDAAFGQKALDLEKELNLIFGLGDGHHFAAR
jgi:hypothetical protein